MFLAGRVWNKVKTHLASPSAACWARRILCKHSQAQGRHKTSISIPILKATIQSPNCIFWHFEPNLSLSVPIKSYWFSLRRSKAYIGLEFRIITGKETSLRRVLPAYRLHFHFTDFALSNFLQGTFTWPRLSLCAFRCRNWNETVQKKISSRKTSTSKSSQKLLKSSIC